MSKSSFFLLFRKFFEYLFMRLQRSGVGRINNRINVGLICYVALRAFNFYIVDRPARHDFYSCLLVA
ncbi:MAG: hypothetical protein ACLFS4_07680 [Opitutales bacterium]